MSELEKIRQVAHHTKEAIELLKRANELNQAEKEGLIQDETARAAAIKLNKQAAEEAEKAIRLNKEILQEKTGNKDI